MDKKSILFCCPDHNSQPIETLLESKTLDAVEYAVKTSFRTGISQARLVILPLVLLCIWFCGPTAAQAQIIWDPAITVASPSLSHNWPRITIDGAGNPVVIWGNAERVMFARWNGNGFTTGVQISPVGMTIAEAGWMGPEIASHGDTIYVVFKETPENVDGKSIWCLRSLDGGETWSDAVKVDQVGSDKARFPVVTTDQEGHPVVGFMRFDPQFRDPHWVVARSQDHGNTFLPDTKASGWSGAGSEVCDCCPGSMHSSGDRIALFYRDNLDNLRECWAGLSSDRGNSFSSGMNMDRTGWRINSCPSSAIDGVILGDSVYSAFMSGAEGAARVYFSRAAFGSSGGIGTHVVPITPDIRSQNYPRVAGLGRALGVIWSQYSGDRFILPILFYSDITTGVPIAIDTLGMGQIENADIAISDDQIFVIWKDGGSKNIWFRSGTWRAPNSILKRAPLLQDIMVFPNPGKTYWRITGQYSGRGNLNAFVINMSGDIKQIIPMQGMTQLELTIDCSDLPAGSYTIRLSEDGGHQQINIPVIKI